MAIKRTYRKPQIRGSLNAAALLFVENCLVPNVESPESSNTPSKINERMLTVSCSVVVIYEKIDIEAFNQIWLTTHGILLESDFTGESLFSSEVVALQTPVFHLLILPERLQLTLLEPLRSDLPAVVERVVAQFVKALPDAKFTVIGFNFGSHLTPKKNGSVAAWSRSVYCPPCFKDLPFAQADNARFGSYFSFDACGFRVRTQITPAILSFTPIGETPPSQEPPIPNNTEVMSFTANFNCAVASRPELLERLATWPEALAISQRIAGHLL